MPVSVSYRVASTDDVDVVVGLLGELVRELGPSELVDQVGPRILPDIRAAVTTPTIRIFLAEVGAQAVGLSRGDILSTDPIFRLRADQRCGYVDQMFVRAPYRDLGIGARLLRCCEDWFRSQGVEHTLLHAAPRAVNFYTRHGYLSNREMFKRL